MPLFIVGKNSASTRQETVLDAAEVVTVDRSSGLESGGTLLAGRTLPSRIEGAIYSLALAASVATWFAAVRAPLWLDETSSFWQIQAGFSQIPARQGISFAAYSYILWLSAAVLGKSEVALRIPEILAMLGAVYLFYRIARELFDQRVAILATIVFSVHPILVFASIDVRPYAFAVLALNAAILTLVRMRRSDSRWLAAAFGFFAACTLYFHLLFAVILPFLALSFLALKITDHKRIGPQFRVALVVFVLASLPVIPSFRFLFRNAGTLNFEPTPNFGALIGTVAPAWILFAYIAAFISVAANPSFQMGKPGAKEFHDWRIWFCAAVGLAPIVFLYTLSVVTPLQVFVPRYRLVALPGIALCWAYGVSLFHSRIPRLVFCVFLVTATVLLSFLSESSRHHGYTWKYALEFADKQASSGNIPVLICSDFPSADYLPMPSGAAVKDSPLFTPLSYYKLTAPAVALPRTLNAEAIRDGETFLHSAAHQRFLLLGYSPSYEILNWFRDNASSTHTFRRLGIFDGIEVLEFVPHSKTAL